MHNFLVDPIDFNFSADTHTHTHTHTHNTGSDFQTLTSQAINFGGASTTNVRINIPNDMIAEATENFMVRLSAAAGSGVAITGNDVATVTILDIDGERLEGAGEGKGGKGGEGGREGNGV